jgi:hypothetical protein
MVGGGVSYILLPPRWRPLTGDVIPTAVRVLQQYLDQPRCRVQQLSAFLDGTGLPCQEGDPPCDRCVELRRSGGHRTESVSAEVEESEASSVVEASSPASIQGFEIGRQLYRTHVRDDAVNLQRFRERLIALKGVCILCRVHPSSTARGSAQHTMTQCPNPLRFRFFDSKKMAQQEGGHNHRGWIVDYAACFRCFNPQAVCLHAVTKEPCEFPDLILPACFAAYHREHLRDVVLPELAGREFADEAAYMLWLGEKRMVYGTEGSNAMYIADYILGLALSGSH